MTPVYSGGLVYEYSEESSGYGLAKINSDSVTENSDFEALMEAFANTKAPDGDGGFSENNRPAECPSQSDTWEVKQFTGQQLPAMPEKAVSYMQKGAGEGPGLAGSGSQNAGGGSSATATAGSGEVTATATGSSADGSPAADSSGSDSSDSGSDTSAASTVTGTVDFAPFAVLIGTVIGAVVL